MTHHLFVYGTLLQPENEFAGYLMHHTTFLTNGKIKGTLYNIGEYPGLVISPKSDCWVHGSIYKVDDEALALIDDYEGYGPGQSEPYLYVRKMLAVETGNGLADAWVYLYNHPVDGLEVIPSGSYLQYLEQKKSPGL